MAVSYDRECDLVLPLALFSDWTPSDGKREIIRPLTSVEQAKLQGRLQALEATLAPYRDDQIDLVNAELAAMLSGFRSMRQQGEDAAGLIEVTRHVLREFPLWAIATGCMSIAQNGYPATRDGVTRMERLWPPNDPQIHAVIGEIVRLRREAMTTIKALLAAPIENHTPAAPPSRDELEKQLGRPLSERAAVTPKDPPSHSDGRHAERIAPDLAARKVRNEMPAANGLDSPDFVESQAER